MASNEPSHLNLNCLSFSSRILVDILISNIGPVLVQMEESNAETLG